MYVTSDTDRDANNVLLLLGVSIALFKCMHLIWVEYIPKLY